MCICFVEAETSIRKDLISVNLKSVLVLLQVIIYLFNSITSYSVICTLVEGILGSAFDILISLIVLIITEHCVGGLKDLIIIVLYSTYVAH